MDKKYNLVVAGGGMSGVTAAVTAAKGGLKVLLIDQASMLGGLGTSGLMTMIMASRHYFYGFGRKLMDSLIAEGSARSIDNYAVKDFQRIPFDAESMKRRLDDEVINAGVDLLLYSKVIDVKVRNEKIEKIYYSNAMGTQEVEADYFIDATGDAMLSFFAGEECEYGDADGNVQSPTMTAYYAGIDFDRYEAFLKTYENGPDPIPKVNMIKDLIYKAAEDGVITTPDEHHPGIFRISPCFNVGVMNAGHIFSSNCITGEGLTNATVAGRKQAKEYLDFYRKYIPGFEKAYMVNTCSYLGLRESRRVVGKYVASFDDKVGYKKYDDCVMRFDGGNISDIHASKPGKEAYKAYYDQFYKARYDNALNEFDWATLRYGSLLPAKTKNMWIAGRCLSADRKIQGQLRIMGYCFMMGEAVGLAAIQAVKSNVLCDQIDIKQLQFDLKSHGVETV